MFSGFKHIMSQTNILVIDSRLRTTGTTNQTAAYSIVNTGGVQGTYEVMGYQSVNQVYTVEVDVNDTIYFTEPAGAGDLSAILPPGTYTQTTLNAAAKVTMEAAGAETYTFAVDTPTGVLTVSVGANTFGWEWFTQLSNGDSANTLFGLSPLDVAPAASIAGDLIPDLRSHTHILVNISEDGNKNITTIPGGEFSMMIPLTSEFGDPIESVKEVTFAQQVLFPSNFTTLNVIQSTEDGVALVNAPDYVLTLRRLF